ncbi:hypothetical protein OB905_13600 [Halobacteria archaeon AArc-dxtr1]|nr:hypothetical protein [Halobacteria archaeon AArc-dxtr1]
MDTEESPIERRHVGREAESPVVAVVQTVAAAANAEATEMSPLHEIVDCDALNTLCTPSERSGEEDSVAVMFSYADYRVRVTNRGEIAVFPEQ